MTQHLLTLIQVIAVQFGQVRKETYLFGFLSVNLCIHLFLHPTFIELLLGEVSGITSRVGESRMSKGRGCTWKVLTVQWELTWNYTITARPLGGPVLSQ